MLTVPSSSQLLRQGMSRHPLPIARMRGLRNFVTARPKGILPNFGLVISGRRWCSSWLLLWLCCWAGWSAGLFGSLSRRKVIFRLRQTVNAFYLVGTAYSF